MPASSLGLHLRTPLASDSAGGDTLSLLSPAGLPAFVDVGDDVVDGRSVSLDVEDERLTRRLVENAGYRALGGEVAALEEYSSYLIKKYGLSD